MQRSYKDNRIVSIVIVAMSSTNLSGGGCGPGEVVCEP